MGNASGQPQYADFDVEDLAGWLDSRDALEVWLVDGDRAMMRDPRLPYLAHELAAYLRKTFRGGRFRAFTSTAATTSAPHALDSFFVGDGDELYLAWLNGDSLGATWRLARDRDAEEANAMLWAQAANG